MRWDTTTMFGNNPHDDGNDNGDDSEETTDLFGDPVDSSIDSIDADEIVDELEEASGPYSFVSAENGEEEDPEEAAEPDQPAFVRRWGLGNHHSQGADQDEIESLLDGLDDEVDSDLRGVLDEAAQMVRSGANNFECPRCGLNHGHSDSKHDIRYAFNVTNEFADQMKWVPYCHCGANELAMLMDFFGYISEPVFTDEEEFGGLNRLSNDVIQDVLRAKRDLEKESLVDVTMEDAAEAAGHEFRVPNEVYGDLRRFDRRAQQIKSAADGAPIPDHARVSIEDTRGEIETAVN